MDATETRGTRVSSVNRWKRFGKDRLYVNASDGRSIGWLDLSTGECVLERPALLPAFEQAIERWKAAQVIGPVTTGAAETSPRRTPPPQADPAGASIIRLAAREQDVGGSKAEPAPAPIVSLRRRRPQPVPRGRESRPTQAGAGDPAALAPLSVVPDAGPEAVGLADNLPGQAARQQADARQEAAPLRTWMARLLGLRTEEGAWRMGADGEVALAKELSKLGSGWHVLHSIPIGHRGSDIDHVVIGSAGVFTINAKHHPNAKVWVAEDTILVNGYRKFYVRNSRHEAGRASRLLSAACRFPVPATGVVAFVDAGGFTVKSEPSDVHVINRSALVAWLRALPRRLSPDEVATIFAAARQSSTWTEM
ncbi:MAG TPA: NERD domain-containing protein [Acidimicrobiales bacterium]|nr:NERD domain-containing protein [Acidimicrobiales bacterium]